jgi:valyl-tRNA synthetase
MNGVAYDPSFKPASVQHPLNQAIVAAFGKTVAAVDEAYAEFRFNDVAQQIYHFTWSLYCDWYLELTKPVMQGTDEAAKDETRRTMGFILESLMRLAHPVMPFITEEIWLNLTAGKKGDTICRAAWPTPAEYPQNPAATEVMDWLIKTVGTLRNARAENRVPPKEELTCGLKGASPEVAARYAAYAPFITFLTKVKGFAPRAEAAAKTDMVAVVDGVELVMPLEGVVDMAAEKARIAKEIEKFEAELTKINTMLGNEGFVARAPQDVVAAQKARRDTLTGDLEKLRASLSSR